jgi:hypothetical protein
MGPHILSGLAQRSSHSAVINAKRANAVLGEHNLAQVQKWPSSSKVLETSETGIGRARI